MDEKYTNRSRSEAFEIFETTVLSESGLDQRAQGSVHELLDDIGRKAQDGLAENSSVAPEIRSMLFEKGDRDTRIAIVAGSLVRGGWQPSRHIAAPRNRLYFPSPSELDRKLITPATVDIAANSLVATNDEHMRVAYVPEAMIGWSLPIYKKGDISQQGAILDSIKATTFGNRTLDRDDPHPIETILSDTSAPEEFQQAMIRLALQEIEDPKSRPKLLDMMRQTYAMHKGLFTEATVRQLRRLSGEPEGNDEYYEFLRIQQQRAADRKEIEHATSKKQQEFISALKAEHLKQADAAITKAFPTAKKQ